MAFMSITREEVAHAELEHLGGQLDQIIAAVARVQEVAAEGIPPMTHAVPVVNVFRADVEVPCLTPEQALAAAPATEQSRFRVPRILSEE
jgi:aspartyl-tRNA(Asn)/glutamyl-tRNA(Gln) amidotransferase subunit C